MSRVHKVRRLLLDWRLLLYNVICVVGSPYFLLRKFRRQLKRANAKGFGMFGWACPLIHKEQHEENSRLPHVVFVSVGLGEIYTTEQLDLALKKICPHIRTTWAVRSLGTAQVVREKYPQQAVTAIPYDFLIPVWGWLRRLDPNVVVMVEKLLAPNIIWGGRRWGALMVGVCGVVGSMRIRGFSGLFWQLVHRWTLQGYSKICFQTSDEMHLVAPLLPLDLDVCVTGSIKISHVLNPDVDNNKDDRGEMSSLSRWLVMHSPVPVLVAGSTKNIEEETLVLKAFEMVRACVPCRLVIAPRRPNRVEEIVTLLADLDITRVSRRSKYLENLCVDASVEVYVLDTLGELSSTYGFAQAAFVGGTLTDAGHNVIEPVVWGVPVGFGPGLGKPTAEQRACIEAGVGFCVLDAQQLAEFWLRVLQEDTWREELRTRAQNIYLGQQQSLAANVAAIVGVLNTLPAR